MTPEPIPLADENAPAQWAALMARAQQGDRAAYLRLMTAVTPLVRALCRRALHQPAEAEDAVQDALLSVHHARHTFDATRPFRPWLVAITQARIADRQRRSVRRSRRETALDASHETFAAADTKHDETTDHDRLHAAIAVLPPGEQRAVRLLKLEELSLQQAAERTGMSIIALKVACHRAIKRLRQIMDPAT